jgi:integrase
MYAGLRRGELQALRARDVDRAAGVIEVERGWDEREGVIELKSRAGRRKVPISAVLHDHLTEHRIRVHREDEELMFGRTSTDAYGHLFPVSEAEAAGLLDSYLNAQRKRSDELARSAGV